MFGLSRFEPSKLSAYLKEQNEKTTWKLKEKYKPEDKCKPEDRCKPEDKCKPEDSLVKHMDYTLMKQTLWYGFVGFCGYTFGNYLYKLVKNYVKGN